MSAAMAACSVWPTRFGTMTSRLPVTTVSLIVLPDVTCELAGGS